LLAGGPELAAGQQDLAEIERGVGERAGIAPAAPDLLAPSIQVDGDLEVAEFRVKPAKTVEQAVVDGLVAESLGQRQPLAERGLRVVVVTLADQRQPVEEEPDEKRDEQVMLARQRERLRLQARGVAECARPVVHETER